MRIRNMSFGVIAIIASISLSACGGNGEPAVGTNEGGDGDSPTIGFSISTLQNPFFVSMEDGVKEAGSAAGIEVLIADAGDDAAKQANDVQNFIAQGADVVILNPTDGDAVVSSVEALNDAGIPVITVDRRSEGGDVVAHLGTDNVIAGEIAATTLFDAISGTGKVAILEGVPGASSSLDRGTGFENVLKDYPDIEIVATQTANFQRDQGLTVAENILQANPDLGAILAMNDEMALGAVEALRSAGKLEQVAIIGIDGGEDAVKAVLDGELVATIAQQSKLMGSLGVEQAVKLAEGESIESEQPVEVIVIDESNAADY